MVCVNELPPDVEIFHGCPYCLVPYSVEGLLEVYEHAIDVSLMLEMFFTHDS